MKATLGLLAAITVFGAEVPSPFTQSLNSLAQDQLKARAGTIASVRDIPAAKERQKQVRTKVLDLLGGLPDARGPLNAKVTRTIERDGYVIENVLFESLPKYFVTANLYRPKQAGKYPAVLMSMGHWEEGKPAAQVLCANLARKGFVVLAYDPVGQGERQQAYDARIGKSIIGGATEQHILNGGQAVLVGQSVARYFIWDGMRAIDYLVSRPEVDGERIGATGCSGGGTQTTYIAALDDRVKAAAPACYMNSFQTLFTTSVGDSEQSFPNFLASGLDQTDYVELFAPKPWLISSTEQDFFTPAGAKQVFDEAKRWYDLFGAEDKIKWVVGPGGHGTPLVVREAIYDWFIKWLKDGKGNSKEERLELIPDTDLQVTARGQVEGRELWQVIRDTPKKAGTPEQLKTFVTDLMAKNPALMRNIQALPERPGSDRRAAVILVASGQAAAEEAKQLAAAGNVVLMVAPSGEGTGRGGRSGNWLNDTRAWMVGRNLAAMHAAEVREAVDMAAKRPDVDPARISARASGTAGISLLLAAATDPRLSSIALDKTPYSVRAALDSAVTTNLHDGIIPGFALSWDLADLRKLVEPRTVTWTNPTDWNGNVVKAPGGFQYTSSDTNYSH